MLTQQQQHFLYDVDIFRYGIRSDNSRRSHAFTTTLSGNVPTTTTTTPATTAAASTKCFATSTNGPFNAILIEKFIPFYIIKNKSFFTHKICHIFIFCENYWTWKVMRNIIIYICACYCHFNHSQLIPVTIETINLLLLPAVLCIWFLMVVNI